MQTLKQWWARFQTTSAWRAWKRYGDARGNLLRKFTVDASYGLGGFAGGIEETRLSWLYEKFTEHTVNELKGERKD